MTAPKSLGVPDTHHQPRSAGPSLPLQEECLGTVADQPGDHPACFTVVFGVFLGVEAPVAGNRHNKLFAYLFTALVAELVRERVNIAMQSFLAAGALTHSFRRRSGHRRVVDRAHATAVETIILLVFMAIIGNLGWTTLIAFRSLPSRRCVRHQHDRPASQRPVPLTSPTSSPRHPGALLRRRSSTRGHRCQRVGR